MSSIDAMGVALEGIGTIDRTVPYKLLFLPWFLYTFIIALTLTKVLKRKDNGFGNSYIWAGSLESGLQIATNHNKPMMLIIHKSWCTACKNLKPKFAQSSDIQALSKHFVMVNLVDEEEPHGIAFAPDGNYIPRILFLSPAGMVDLEVFNEEGSSQHKYFYSRPEQIANSMKKVLVKYKVEQFDV